MKLAIGLLVVHRHHHEAALKVWADAIGATMIVHSAQAYTGVAWRDCLVPTVPTSWAHTIKAHYQIYERFLQTDCDRLVIMSESCLPIREPDEAKALLEKETGALLMQHLTHPQFKSKQWFKPNHRWRNVATKAHAYLEYHEQWYSLTRELVEAMMEPAIMRWTLTAFDKSGGDNEMFVATTLRFIKQAHKIKEYPMTWCDWGRGSTHHPYSYDALTQQDVDSLREQGYIFVRKVPAGATITADLNYYHMARKKKQAAEGVKLVPVVLTNDPNKPMVQALVKELGAIVANWGQGGNIAYEGHFTSHANAAISLAIKEGATHVWLLSDDVAVPIGAKEDVASALGDPTIGYYTPFFNSTYPFLHNQGSEGLREVPFVEPTAAVVSVAAWGEVGTYNEAFVRGWGVCEDYSLRLRQAGYKCVVDDRVGFYHKVQDTVKHEPGYEQKAMEELRYLANLHGAQWPQKLHQGYPDTTSWMLEQYNRVGRV